MSRPGSSIRQGLVSDSALYFAANLVGAAVPFLLLPILTRHLTPAEYGRVAIFQGLASGLAAMVGLSVHGAANRKYYDAPDRPQEMREFIGACLQILLATSTVTLLLLLLLRRPLAGLLGLPAAWLPWSVAVSAAGFVTAICLSQWQARRHAFRYGMFQMLQALGGLLLTLLLVVGLHHGESGRIAALIATAVLSAFAALLFLQREGRIGWAWRPDHIREALAFGVPLVPHVAGLFLLGMADRFVINQTLGAHEAGIYAVAVQLSLVMGILFDAINKAYVPWLFERLQRDDAALKRQIVGYTYACFAAALGLAALAFAIGPFAVSFLAGREYGAAGSIIGWLMLGQAFSGMYLMVTNYVFYSRRTGLLSLVTAGSGLLNLLLLVALVALLGVQGAALAFASAMALRFGATWWLAQHVHPMPWLHFFKPTQPEKPHV